MTELNPRIKTALTTVTFSEKHGAPSPLGALRGVTAEMAAWQPYDEHSLYHTSAIVVMKILAKHKGVS